jgi:hypothetical protein
LTQNEIKLNNYNFLAENKSFLTRARAILYQIATPDAKFLNLNTGSLNKKAAESDKFLYFPKITLSTTIISLEYAGYY